MEIYEPSEDSYFFSDFLKNYFSQLTSKKISYLDLGSGSGILARTAATCGIPKKSILSTDINSAAVKKLLLEGFNAKKSNLFKELNKSKRFDIITFNAPYLPREPRENKSTATITCGGIRGDEISLRFLKKARSYLKDKGKIFLLISSLTPLERISKFNPRIVGEKQVFFEKLLILQFSK